MIQAVIIDDEISNIENLSILLEKYCTKIKVAAVAKSVDEGLTAVRETNPAIVFLDIQLGGQTGFDFLTSLVSPAFEVIFVTAYHEYAIQAIRFSAIDYLLKPININDLVNSIDRAVANIEKKKYNDRLENLIRSINNKSQLRIAIPGNKETLFLTPDSVLYCKADNNYTMFYMKAGEKSISSKPIFEYEELLAEHGFVRCHQSYLVNLAHVKSWTKVDGDRLVITDGQEIPVSRNNKEKLRKAIGLR